MFKELIDENEAEINVIRKLVKVIIATAKEKTWNIRQRESN